MTRPTHRVRGRFPKAPPKPLPGTLLRGTDEWRRREAAWRAHHDVPADVLWMGPSDPLPEPTLTAARQQMGEG